FGALQTTGTLGGLAFQQVTTASLLAAQLAGTSHLDALCGALVGLLLHGIPQSLTGRCRGAARLKRAVQPSKWTCWLLLTLAVTPKDQGHIATLLLRTRLHDAGICHIFCQTLQQAVAKLRT